MLPPAGRVWMEDTCVCAARKGEECRDESQTSCVMVVVSALSGIDVNRTRTSCPNESVARGKKGLWTTYIIAHSPLVVPSCVVRRRHLTVAGRRLSLCWGLCLYFADWCCRQLAKGNRGSIHCPADSTVRTDLQAKIHHYYKKSLMSS